MAEIQNSSEVTNTSATFVLGKTSKPKSINEQTSEIIKTLNIEALLNRIKKGENDSVPVYLLFKDTKRKYKPVRYSCLKTTCLMILLPDDLKGNGCSEDDLELASLRVQTSRTREILPEQKRSNSYKEKNTHFFEAAHPKPTYSTTIELKNRLSHYFHCNYTNECDNTRNEKCWEFPQTYDRDDLAEKGTNENRRCCEAFDNISYFSYTSEQITKRKVNTKHERHSQNQHHTYISKNEDTLNNSFRLTSLKPQDTKRVRKDEKCKRHGKHKGISYVPCTDDQNSKRLCRFPARFKRYNTGRDTVPLKSTSEKIVRHYDNDAVHLRAVKSERRSNACKFGNGISQIVEIKHGYDHFGGKEEREGTLGAMPGFSFKLDKSDLEVKSNSTVIDEDCLIKIQEEQRYLQPFTITMNESVNTPLKIYDLSSIKRKKLFVT